MAHMQSIVISRICPVAQLLNVAFRCVKTLNASLALAAAQAEHTNPRKQVSLTLFIWQIS